MESWSCGSSWLSPFPPVTPQPYYSNVPVLFELLRGEEAPSRAWLRAEMNQISDPLIDSLFSRLISSSSTVPQSRSNVSELVELLQGEKAEVSIVLRGEMDRLVNALFERLTNKLRINFADWDREENARGDGRAQMGNLLDRVESPNAQAHQQPSSLFAKPLSTSSSSSFNPNSHQQQLSNGNELKLNTVQMIEIKEEAEDEEETRAIDIAGLSEDRKVKREIEEDCEMIMQNVQDSATHEQIEDCVKHEIKEEFDYGHEIEIKQEEEEENTKTTNKEEMVEVKEEMDEDGETHIGDIEGLVEYNQSGDDESRSVENAHTTSAHPIGQSQANRQSGRIENQTGAEPQDELMNNDHNREDIEEDDEEKVTFARTKRARPSSSITSSGSTKTSQKQVITVTLRCPQVGCPVTVAQDHFNKHLWDSHSILPFRCLVKDCGQSFTNKYLGEHLSQVHSPTTQWPCGQCAKQFTTYHLLTTHNTQQHQLGHFECAFPLCTFTAEYKGKVRNHYIRVHRSSFACHHADCPFKSPSAAKLKQHLRVHSGSIKPYRCKWACCEYSSGKQSYTMRHIRRHLKRNPRPTGSTQLAEPKDFLEVIHELLD